MVGQYQASWTPKQTIFRSPRNIKGLRSQMVHSSSKLMSDTSKYLPNFSSQTNTGLMQLVAFSSPYLHLNTETSADFWRFDLASYLEYLDWNVRVCQYFAGMHGRFLVENVASMTWIDREEISKYLKVQPLELDSIELTPSRRKRLYWTNIPHPSRLPRVREHPSTFVQSCLHNAIALEEKTGVLLPWHLL